MARPLRIEYSGALYHVTSRGNEKKPIFKEEGDREVFLELLDSVNKRYNWMCHAYILMNNHYHLVIETPEGNLSKGMRQLNGVYTQVFNKRHRRVGHLFQGRYKAILIQKESHLVEVCKYVVLNAVRAGLVRNPKEWRWSSYCATVGIAKPHACLTTDWILGQFGTKKLKTSRKRYMKYITNGREEESLWSNLKGQILLGGEDFAERFLSYVKEKREIEEIPRSQRFASRLTLDRLFEGKENQNREERNRRIREAVENNGYTQKEVAKYLKIHYSTISRIMKNE